VKLAKDIDFASPIFMGAPVTAKKGDMIHVVKASARRCGEGGDDEEIDDSIDDDSSNGNGMKQWPPHVYQRRVSPDAVKTLSFDQLPLAAAFKTVPSDDDDTLSMDNGYGRQESVRGGIQQETSYR
jgi:hypothetical protein